MFLDDGLYQKTATRYQRLLSQYELFHNGYRAIIHNSNKYTYFPIVSYHHFAHSLVSFCHFYSSMICTTMRICPFFTAYLVITFDYGACIGIERFGSHFSVKKSSTSLRYFQPASPMFIYKCRATVLLLFR